jgi:glycosyltransferase involved in cell wall biosynthesis
MKNFRICYDPPRLMLRPILHTLRHAVADRLRHVVRAATRQKRTLRVGVDIRPFYEPLTGIGWYLHHLLHELAKDEGVELYLFGDARVTDLGPHLHTELPARAHLCTFDFRGRGKISRLERAATAAAYVAWMKLVDCDVMFGANYFLPRLHAAVARRRVVTVHDLTYKRFPELLQNETLANLERHMKRELAQSDAVICVSESTRQDLLRFYEADPSRVVTVLSGAAPMPLSPGHEQRTALPQRYLLFVSTIEPRKNLGVLLDAFEDLKARGAYGGSLVVVGRIGWKSESMVKRLRGRDVHHLDYLEAEELAAVYAGAELFVFPSLYEGFGFPLVEAMAHGVPAIAARSSSLPEVGGDAALYFEPTDAKELAAAIERVTTDAALRASLVARGHARVGELRWDRAAAETLAVLRRAAG